MSEANDRFGTLQPFEAGQGRQGWFYSLPRLEQTGIGPISRLPISIRLVLESVLRNCDGKKVTEANESVKTLAAWNANADRTDVEIPLRRRPHRVAGFYRRAVVGGPGRDALSGRAPGQESQNHRAARPGGFGHRPFRPGRQGGNADALRQNLDLEFQRNRERYQFLKWGMQAFETFSVVPPAIGIVHQVNLEYLAKLVFEKNLGGKTVFYPDSLVGTDSHTTMINGLGIVGWGVGGIEAEAGMLGQPVAFQTPEVIGVHLTGKLRSGVTATDMTLRLTEILRKAKVVGKFVEFYGEGAEALGLADRATIANMAPEYGATMGFFPVDEKSLDYLRQTGRDEKHIALVKEYYAAQGLFGIPKAGDSRLTRKSSSSTSPPSGPASPAPSVPRTASTSSI